MRLPTLKELVVGKATASVRSEEADGGTQISHGAHNEDIDEELLIAEKVVGAIVMFCLWRFTTVNGYLYTISGMLTCVGVGLLLSLVTGPQEKDLRGLTIYTLAEDNT